MWKTCPHKSYLIEGVLGHNSRSSKRYFYDLLAICFTNSRYSHYDEQRRGRRLVEDLFKTKHYHHCLFFCHLFVEKVIKALIVKNTDENPLPIHKLRLLAKSTGVEFSKEQLKLLDKITGFNIKARYNDIKFKFYKTATKEFTEEYFRKSKEIYQWLKNQL